MHAALKNPSRAILQFYPTSDDQIQLITSIAQKAGFGGGVVVDYPNSKKARKVFLCLFVGGGGGAQVPKGLEGEEVEANEGKALFEKRRERMRAKGKDGKRKSVKDRDWILKKKEVSFITPDLCLCADFFLRSFTANAERRAYLATQNILDANGRLSFNVSHPVTV